MSFIKETHDVTRVVDTVFAVNRKATKAKQIYGNDAVIDATIGSLYDEEGNLVALKTVFDNYNAIDNKIKAKYAADFSGNEAFKRSVNAWIKGDNNLDLSSSVVATPGGTGAINLTIDLCLEKGQTLIIPSIAWGSYAIMANNAGAKVKRYEMFDGDSFNLSSFKEVCSEVMNEQKKVVVIINDPCHNPTGYSMTQNEWKEVVEYLNELSKMGSVVLLNDIAYMDYSYNLEEVRNYLNEFNHLLENVLVIVAFSCSKLMTSYGLRCGAALIMGKDEKAVNIVEGCFEKSARALWSNVNNSAMENFDAIVSNHLDEFMNEKQMYIDLLHKRSEIIVKEANDCGLPIYPYKEGFFVTVKVDNEIRDKYHEALMDNLIFTVKVNNGIRIAACSLPIEKCKGIAKRMNEILKGLK